MTSPQQTFPFSKKTQKQILSGMFVVLSWLCSSFSYAKEFNMEKCVNTKLCNEEYFEKIKQYGISPFSIDSNYVIEIIEKKSGIENIVGRIEFLVNGEVIFENKNNADIEELKNDIEKRKAVNLLLGGSSKGIHYKKKILIPQYTDYFIPAVEKFLTHRGFIIKELTPKGLIK